MRTVLAVLAGLLFMQAALAAVHSYEGGCESGLCVTRCDIDGYRTGPAPFHPPVLAPHPASRVVPQPRIESPVAADCGTSLPVAAPPPRILFQSFLL